MSWMTRPAAEGSEQISSPPQCFKTFVKWEAHEVVSCALPFFFKRTDSLGRPLFTE